MPLIASSPILPPGKNSGVTTKESVVKAMRADSDVEHRLVVQLAQQRIIERRQEQVADQLRGEPSAAAVAHHDGLVLRQRQRARECERFGSRR